jgi:hypothetical protein
VRNRRPSVGAASSHVCEQKVQERMRETRPSLVLSLLTSSRTHARPARLPHEDRRRASPRAGSRSPRRARFCRTRQGLIQVNAYDARGLQHVGQSLEGEVRHAAQHCLRAQRSPPADSECVAAPARWLGRGRRGREQLRREGRDCQRRSSACRAAPLCARSHARRDEAGGVRRLEWRVGASACPTSSYRTPARRRVRRIR